MRLVSLSMVWTACAYVISMFLTNEAITWINAYHVWNNLKDVKIDLIVIDWVGAATFAGAGLAGKATQSFAEVKLNKPATSVEDPKPVEEPTKEPG